ncbi:zinc finger and SCAN domain-containing protein 5B isoform X8 [Salmo salar]|uniref:Zinc finger and SCAN domain-containing protein 5B isoform X8 n=1 Tax=Salmo salar TaxID=8030 RepID=A0A1S3RDU4_SALSA|nr:zinc finger and SCAN domain-containing protein 5B-like isoform X8 [Salmo salar]
MAKRMVFHTQIASIMEVLANAAVAEICKLVDDDYAVFRLEITQSQKENRALRTELKVARERAERTIRERALASRPSSVKILDRYRGMARGEGHSCFMKPAEHNAWRDDQPIAINEGTGTSTQHVIVKESAEAAGPGVKLERSEGEHPRHSRDIQDGAASGVAPPVAMEDPTTTPALPRTRHSITDVSGTLNAVLKSETDTTTLTVLERLDCSPGRHSEYLLYGSPRKVLSHQDSSDTLQNSNDPSYSYTTETIPGDMPVGLDTQTNPMRGDWNQYSGNVYSEGSLDKKGEGLVVDEVTVKEEGDPLTWNADDTHLGGQPQGNTSDFLDYRESLEPNPNIATHSPLHAFRDSDPESTSMAPSNLHGCVLFDQVLNSKDVRSKTRGEGATSGNSKEKRFLCMFCNKGFSCPQKVEIHQRVHTGEKPFSCTQCHMRFTQSGNLKIHQRVHIGVKPFSCTQCHMCFSQAWNLKSHQRVHSGEKPFSCPQCHMSFSHSSSLKRHQRVHTGKKMYSCH